MEQASEDNKEVWYLYPALKASKHDSLVVKFL